MLRREPGNLSFGNPTALAGSKGLTYPRGNPPPHQADEKHHFAAGLPGGRAGSTCTQRGGDGQVIEEEQVMNAIRSIRRFMYTVLLVAAVNVGLAAAPSDDVPIHLPRTELARDSAATLHSAARAFLKYHEACARGDHAPLEQVLTADTRIEYSLREPDSWLSTSAVSPSLDCASRLSATPARIAELWVFPTANPNAVFIEYELRTGGSSRRELALVEMKDGRIARLLSFAEPPTSMLAGLSR